MASGPGGQPTINVIPPRSLFPQPSPAGYGQPPVRPLTGVAPVLAPMVRLPPRPLLPRPQMPPRPIASPVTLVAPGAPTHTPAIVPPEQTTLYVGKIASSIGDDVVLKLLEACGPVKSWKRMEDPDTKALKPFGFCEYEDAEGVIRALALLQNLAVGGQELLLKCNSGTQKYIDYVNLMKSRDAQKKEEDGDKMETDGEEGKEEKSEVSAAELDNKALETIMGIVSSLAEQLPAPPEAAKAAEAFLNKLTEEESEKEKGIKLGPRDRHRVGRRETRDRLDEKALEESFQQEKDAERREADRRAQEHDQTYKIALRKWEMHESDIRKALMREKDHERDLAKERSRQCRADLEDPETQLKPWQRKFFAGSRHAVERKRWRDKEQHDDEADREREAEEVVKRAKLQGENGFGQASPGTSSQAPPSNPRLDDPNDSITQAMMNAAKAPRKTSSLGAPPASPQPTPEPPVVKPVRKPALAAFGADEEEDKPRQLKTINYSAEEQKAAQQKLPSAKEKASAIKALIAKVPTDTKAVFGYKINWKAFDEGGDALKEKIQQWVAQKTTQLLGMEEASMIKFIMEQLTSHVSASKLLQEVQDVLDDEANPFIFKLYRMVIFESLKQESGLQD